MTAGVLALAAVVVSLAFGPQSSAPPNEPAIPAAAGIGSWHDNGAGGRYVLRLYGEGATVPAGTVAGVVMTDSNCDPDESGLSHCHNVIELANGARITVVDTHQMSVHRCLRPGEPIRLHGMGGPWVLGRVRA